MSHKNFSYEELEDNINNDAPDKWSNSHITELWR